MALFDRFFGRTIGEGAAFAIGSATSRTLHPVLQDLTNEAWQSHPVIPLDAGDAAEIVAEDVEQLAWGQAEANQTGIDNERFNALVEAVRNAPGIPQLFEAWRRDLIGDGEFEHGLAKARLEPRWIAPLKGLKQRLLSLDELANARQQGFVTEGRQKSEAALQGLDGERADILFQLSGLPPGVDVGQRAANRNLIDRDTFAQIVREGHTKTKYTELLWLMRHPVLSAPEYATLHLKGWISVDEMNVGGALTGYTPEQMNLLFLARGRPVSPTQGWNAIARSAAGPRGGTFGKDDFLRAIQQSDIRPEYGATLYDLRYNYPSLFQLRRAVQDGSIAPARARRILHFERYEDQDADALIESWTRTSAAGVKALTASVLLAEYEGGFLDGGTLTARLGTLGYSAADAALYAELGEARRLKSARDSTLTTIRGRYVNHKLTRDEMLARLGETGVPGETQTRLVEEWDVAREATLAQLTPAQVKKAYFRLLYTRERAVAELEERGYSTEDANTLLDE